MENPFALAAHNYASIEEDSNGQWMVWNEVTGLIVAEKLTLEQARKRMMEIAQRYIPIEPK